VCSVDDEAFWLKHLEGPIPPSIALDYGVIMVCSKEWISSLLQSFSYLGGFVGYLLMGHLADNVGRKRVEFASWIINLLGIAILMASGTHLYLVGISNFLTGFGSNAVINLDITFLKELSLGNFRERSIVVLQIIFSLGVSLVALSCLLIPEWKVVTGLCIGVPALVVTGFSFIIEETPYFSLKKGRGELLASLNRIARYNRTEELVMEDL
jgi:MFS family permease